MNQLAETPEEQKIREADEAMIVAYVKDVEATLARYNNIGDLIRDSHVPLDKVYRAMAQFYDVNNKLASEYQRAKMHHQSLERRYQVWYDKKFTEARQTVMGLYFEVKGSLKPSVKEYEIQVRVSDPHAYETWQTALQLAEAKVQFLLRLRENLDRHHTTLKELSASMRSEIRALQISEPSQEGTPLPPSPLGGSSTTTPARFRGTLHG